MTSALDFLRVVLPPPAIGAYTNLHYMTLTSDGKRVLSGRAFENFEELVKFAGWAKGQGGITDMYICVSSQSRCIEQTYNNRVSRKAVRNQQNAVALKSLFLDVDVKDGFYQSQGDAIQALQVFVQHVGLPGPSMIVESGSGGLHVYWAFKNPVPPSEWLPLAHALRNAANEHGFKLDPVVTIDSARLLRLPETKNYKTATPTDVVAHQGSTPEYEFDDIASRLAKYITPVQANGSMPTDVDRVSDLVPRPFTNVSNDLAAGIIVNTHDVKLLDLAKACPFVGKAVIEHGSTYPEPQWYQTVYMAAFTEEGEAAAHAMSDQHPSYSHEETARKYAQAVAQRESGKGWPSCQSIANTGAEACRGCPHANAGKSPFHHAERPVGKPQPHGLYLPAGYIQENGVVQKRIVTEEGTDDIIDVIRYPLSNVILQAEPYILHFDADLGKDVRNRHISIPVKIISDRRSLLATCGEQGFTISVPEFNRASEFFMAWVRHLQDTKDRVVASSTFGWAMPQFSNKIEGFTYAGKTYLTNGSTRPAMQADPQIAKQYEPTGDLKPWIDAAKMTTEQKRYGLTAILASAFAAPLVRFTGQEGCMLNVYSNESGIGKTTTMKIAQAVWGNPVTAMQTLSDTQNSALKRMGEIKHLPLMWDEMKSGENIKAFIQIQFSTTQGREKTRMNADGSLRVSGTWQTMMVSASNDSLIPYINQEQKSTTAGLYRTFEYALKKETSQLSVSSVSRLVGSLNSNFGRAGEVYAQFLGTNVDRIAKEVAEEQDEIARDTRMEQDERFWITTIVTLVMGAKYANELGLTDIDVDELKDFLYGVLSNMRRERENTPSDLESEDNIATIFAQFFKEQRPRHYLETNMIPMARGRPARGTVQIYSDVSKLDGGITVHVARNDRLMRVSRSALVEFLERRGLAGMCGKIEKALNATPGVKILGVGTDYHATKENIFDIDLTDPKAVSIIGDMWRNTQDATDDRDTSS